MRNRASILSKEKLPTRIEIRSFPYSNIKNNQKPYTKKRKKIEEMICSMCKYAMLTQIQNTNTKIDYEFLLVHSVFVQGVLFPIHIALHCIASNAFICNIICITSIACDFDLTSKRQGIPMQCDAMHVARAQAMQNIHK